MRHKTLIISEASLELKKRSEAPMMPGETLLDTAYPQTLCYLRGKDRVLDFSPVSPPLVNPWYLLLPGTLYFHHALYSF